MRIYGKNSLLRGAIFCFAFTCCAWSSIAEVKADSWGGGSGGSWGGSGGSWGGSGGSYGSGGGLFGGRRPIRNLLGRIGDRFHGGSHGGGSYGGSNGGSWGGSTGYASGGSHGSVGHSFASTGSYGSAGFSYGSMGSVGSSYGSVGSSYGSTGSSSYGSVGTGYGSTGNGSVGMSYGSYSAPMSSGGVIYDSGYSPVITDGTMAPAADGFQPVPGIYYEGGNGVGTPTPATSAPSTAPAGGSGTDFQPPVSSGTDESTSIVPDGATVLSLRVPTDAQVYINDHKTKTKGDVRRYVSRNLKSGREYYYHVKAVVVRNGKKIERNELVSLKAGEAEAVEFDFEKSVTSLALNVPANAKVTLCGKKTAASGDSRHFSTTKLEPGQVWNDYTIEVALESNGKIVRQEKKIKMVGGESYQLTFEFDAAKELLAVR